MNNKLIDIIRTNLLIAKQTYYNNEPTMSDIEFDLLENELKKLSPNDEYFNSIGVVPNIVTKWEKMQHIIPMTSLNKVNSKNEFKKWSEQVNGNGYIIIPKFDGISIEIIYENGNIKRAITRGDGTIGEDILNNILKMKGVPKSIPNKAKFVCVRGEIIMREQSFRILNDELVKQGQKPYSNKRNAASGIAKRFDGKQSEFLEIICYDILSETIIESETEKMTHLKKLGFNSNHNMNASDVSNKSLEDMLTELVTIFEYWETEKEKLDYDIDGVVISINNTAQQNKLGSANGNPKGKIAWKFKQLAKSTKLLDIKWQTGNSRRITPVLFFEEIHLAGANITNATLHNLEMFKVADLREGEIILIKRAGEVIPYFEKSLVKGLGGRYSAPPNCPSCLGPTTEEGKYLVCDNMSCDALGMGDILKWINSLEIMDVSEKTIHKLFEHQLIKDCADLYQLSPDDFIRLEGLGEKSFNKFKKQLDEKKEVPLEKFVKGLNIEGMGEGICVKLINAGFDTLNKIQELKISDFYGDIDGVKEKIGEKILRGLENKKILINKLLESGIKIKQKKENTMLTKQVTAISGKRFVFTGKIERMNTFTNKNYKREELQKIVSDMGGLSDDSVKANTDYLVQADKNSISSKSEKARKLGTIILSEEEFFGLVGL